MRMLGDLYALVGERERPNLRDVRAAYDAHSFPFVKQDRSTCRRYMRIVHCQNGEQVSRAVLTYLTLSARQSWSTRQLARAILAYLQDAPSNDDDWEEVQPRSVTGGWSACRRMEESSLAEAG